MKAGLLYGAARSNNPSAARKKPSRPACASGNTNRAKRPDGCAIALSKRITLVTHNTRESPDSPLKTGNCRETAEGYLNPRSLGFARNAGRRYTEGMENAEIQIVSNEAGEPTAVIVPIELWRGIESERETAYLLKSEAMKQRLLAARQRQEGLSLEAVVEKLRI